MRQELIDKMTPVMRDRFEKWWTQGDKLLAYTGGLINWVGDYLTDENVEWSKETMKVDDIILTGTNPEFNAVIVDQCQRDAKQLRDLLNSDSEVKKLFDKIEYNLDNPILVRKKDDNFMVLDGMYEMMALVRDNVDEIEVYVAREKPGATPLPYCEPHLIYDIIRPCHRGYNRDIPGVIAALRFVKNSYANAKDLIKERFNEKWVLEDEELSKAIKQLLEE